MAEDAEALARLAYAVQCAYDSRAIGASGAEGHALQTQATVFCDGVRSSPDGWRLALALFRSPEFNSHAKFFALSLLQSRLGAIEGSAAALQPAARLEVRVGLLRWIGDGLAAQEQFIRTKLAVVLALCVKCDYPEVWPTAFVELLALVHHGPSNTELLVRILEAVDDEIVTFHVDRAPAEIAHNSAIKDRMRATGAVFEVVACLCEVVRRHGAHDPPTLANLALTTFQRYVGWVDAACVVADNVLALLYGCLQRPPLAEAALGCVLEVVHKGMPEGEKVGLLAHLRVNQLVGAVPHDDDDVSEAAAEIVNAAGLHLLSAYDAAEPDALAGGRGSAAAGPGGAAAAAAALLHELPLLRFLGHREPDVSGAVLPLVLRLLDTVKRQDDQDNAAGATRRGAVLASAEGVAVPPFVASDLLPRLLPVLFDQLQYSEGFDFAQSDEDEAEEEMHRRSVRRLFVKVVKVCPSQALDFVCSVVGAALHAGPLSQLPAARAEAVLRLAYHFCEGFGAKHQGLVNEGAFPALLTALHQSDVVAHPHWAVAVLYFELADRYWKHVRDDPILVGAVLQHLCSARGISSPQPTLRARGCFLLKSLAKHLGPDVTAPFAPDVLAGVRSLLFGGLLDASPGDMSQLFELAAVLSASLDPPAQTVHLDALIEPLLARLQHLLQQPPGDSMGERLAQQLAYLATASKGTSRPQPHLQAIYRRALDASAAALAAMPRHLAVRARFVTAMHRLLPCLDKDALLGTLPAVLLVLLVGGAGTGDASDETKDLDAVAPLVNQLVLCFEAALAPALDPVLLPFLHRVLRLVAATVDESGGDAAVPHVAATVAALQRHCLMLLHHLVAHGLATPVLASARNRPHLATVLGVVVAAVGDLEPLLAKLGVATLLALARGWLTTPPPPGVDPAAVAAFLVDVALPACFRALLAPSFRPKDANSARVVAEVAALAFFLYQALGPRFVAQLVGDVLPRLDFPPDLAARLGASFEGRANGAEFEAQLRACLEAR